MNRADAYEKAKGGEKITHAYFQDHEYLEYRDGQIFTEDGRDFETLFCEYGLL